MKREELCEIIRDIDENYVKEAGADCTVRRPGWNRWVAMAACLCLIAVTAITVPVLFRRQESNHHVVTAPGFLTLTAYAASPEEEDVVMQEGVEITVNDIWTPAMSSRPGIPLNLSAPDYPDAMFEVSVDGGALLLWEENKITHIESPFHAENGTTVYWTSTEPNMKNEGYMSIVIREGETIIGYAVVEVYTDHVENEAEQTDVYHARLLQSVSFPNVNGTCQRITAEYVEAEIQKIKTVR